MLNSLSGPGIPQYYFGRALTPEFHPVKVDIIGLEKVTAERLQDDLNIAVSRALTQGGIPIDSSFEHFVGKDRLRRVTMLPQLKSHRWPIVFSTENIFAPKELNDSVLKSVNRSSENVVILALKDQQPNPGFGQEYKDVLLKLLDPAVSGLVRTPPGAFASMHPIGLIRTGINLSPDPEAMKGILAEEIPEALELGDLGIQVTGWLINHGAFDQLPGFQLTSE